MVAKKRDQPVGKENIFLQVFFNGGKKFDISIPAKSDLKTKERRKMGENGVFFEQAVRVTKEKMRKTKKFLRKLNISLTELNVGLFSLSRSLFHRNKGHYSSESPTKRME